MDSDAEKPRPAAVFVTTQWTRVLAAKGSSVDARGAMKELCGTYYEPVVAYLRCVGNSDDAARELAHGFFASLLERDALAGLERGRGLFRSYLLGALKHHVADRWNKEKAAKRGGDQEHVPLATGSDTTAGVDPVDSIEPGPETAFDRRWALTVLDRALGRLETECQSAGKSAQFDVLKHWLIGNREGMTQAEAGEKLAMNEGAVKVAIHRLRKRFRELVKREIGETVGSTDQIEDELGSLIAALSSSS